MASKKKTLLARGQTLKDLLYLMDNVDERMIEEMEKAIRYACGQESPSPDPECNDGVDNDGDSLIDYPNDPGCSSSSDDDETNIVQYQCNDGIDNDGDSLIDYPSDPGCCSSSDNDEYNYIQTGDIIGIKGKKF